MKTKKQEELVNSFLSMLGEEDRLVYQDIVMHLSELGYNPRTQRSNIVFKHDFHNKQMVKLGFTRSKNLPYLELRFSACSDYSKRFEDIVIAAVSKPNYREAQCIYKLCNYCAGSAFSHVYTYIFPNGEARYHCGATALEIPDIKADDVAEIKKLITEEHKYLMKYQASVIV